VQVSVLHASWHSLLGAMLDENDRQLEAQVLQALDAAAFT
jgi:hypothetical protein